MTTAATIVSLKGEAFARTASGGMRRLAQGDTIQVGEVLITSLGAEVSLKTADGQTINVGGQESLGFGPESAAGTAPGAAEAAVAGAPAPTAVAPQEGIDVEQILEQEAAAAGLAGGGENSGNSFVRLLRIVEEINPLAYEFPNPIENEILPAGPGNQNSLPTAGDLIINLDEDDIQYQEGEDVIYVSWYDEFRAEVGEPGGYYDNGNSDVRPGDDVPDPSPVTMVGTLNFSYGPDGVGDIKFNMPAALSLASGGQDLQYWLSSDGHTVVGYVLEGGYSSQQSIGSFEEYAYVKVIFSADITDATTGAFSFTLYGPLDHPDPGTEDNRIIPLGFTVTDGNGDSVTGTLSANIDDDSPTWLTGGENGISASVKEEGMSVAYGDDGDLSTGNEPFVAASGFFAELASSGSGNQSSIESFLGIPAGSLTALAASGEGRDNATNGSAMKTVVDVNAGDQVSFGWAFDADDYLSFNDFAFVVINGQPYELADISQVGSYGATNWAAFNYMATSTGPLTIGFGVMNTGDSGVNTYLMVDNVRVNGVSVPNGTFESGFAGWSTLGTANVTNYHDEIGASLSLHTSDETSSYLSGSLAGLVSFGADGPGEFGLISDPSALPTLYSQGEPVGYSVVGSTLTATAGADEDARVVFTLTVNPDGSWYFDLDDQLDHVPGNGENYALVTGGDGDGGYTSVSNIDFSSIIQVTDGDGDVLKGTPANILTITVQDDIPVLDVGLYEAGEDTQYDGLPLLSTQDAETDGDPTETDTATASFAKFFTLSSSVGSDEPSDTEPALVYSLSIGDSGGEDQMPGYTGLTSQGHPITLAMDGDDIVGSIMSTYGYSGVVSTPIFRISVDADTGVVTLSQYEQIDHLPEVADETNDNYEAYLPEGSIILTASASITDFDGDTASDSQALDISESFRFDDDVPTAEPDTNTVEEGAVLTVSAAAGVLANDALGADGATIYGVRAAEGDTDTPVSSGVGEDIDGEYGTLHLYADGSYTYTSWGDATDEDAVDTFVYTLKDGDNDLSTTTLEINVKDNSSMMISAWNDSQHTGEFEPTGDNKTATFTVTEAQIENNANATAWIGNLLKAGEAVPPAVVAAHPPLNTTLAVTSDITFTFISETAGFQNTVGWYDVNDPTVGYIVWANSSAAGSGGSLNPGSSTVTVNGVPAGTQIGFFMIPDAFSPDPGPANVPLDAGDKVYFNGGHAYRDAAYTQLINSTDNDMPGDADPVWFSNNTNLDGLQHVVTGLAQGEPTNLLYVGFEDLGGGGDRDYEDVIFKVDLGDGNNVVADPVVFNLGVDLPDAADLKSATIDFTLGDGDTIEWDVALAASLNLKVTQTDPDSYTIEAEDLLTGESGASFDELLDTFQINVGHTNAGDDYTKVDTDQRSAEVSVIDIYDNASNDVTALFNLTKVTPEP